MRFFRKSLKKRNYKTRVYLLTFLGDTLFFEYKRIKSASSDGRWAFFYTLVRKRLRYFVYVIALTF